MTRNSPESELARGIENSCDQTVDSWRFDRLRKRGTTAHIRYAEVDEEGNFSQRFLRPIKDAPPDWAMFRSPGIYFLTGAEQDKLANGTPAKSIQEQCRWNQTVYYNIVAESDGIEDGVPIETIIDWLTTYTEDWLGIDEYTLFYSGNRSIHLHANAYVTHDDWTKLRTLTKQFNQEEDAALDPSIYKRKAQFRLPGTKHEETGLYKVPIGTDADRTACIREAQNRSRALAEPGDSPETYHWSRVGGKEILPSEISRRLIQVHIKEDSDVHSVLHNKPFSPYTNVRESGDSSLIVFEQKEEMFEREGTHYVPCYIIRAVGGDGDSDDDGYARYNSYSAVKLSPIDATKWDFSPGDYGLIIGRANGQSILHHEQEEDAWGYAAMIQEFGKTETLTTLSQLGYEVGTDGVVEGNYQKANDGEGTEAAKLKRQMEDGEALPTRDNCFQIACRLLQIRGFLPAMQWFKHVLGEAYDAEKTYRELVDIIDSYPEEYGHVEVPPRGKVVKEM